MITKVPYILGYVSLKSNLTLEEVGKVLSDKVFGGLQFGGKDLDIHEEIPAIFIQAPIMGLKIILEGYSGLEENNHFTLSVRPWMTLSEFEHEEVNLNQYLIALLKTSLKGETDILI